MKVLHLILHHQLYPPKNGGMLRSWNIREQLSKHFEVDVITLQDDIQIQMQQNNYAVANGTRFFTPAMFSVRNSKTGFPFLKKIFPALQYRWFFKTLSPADAGLVSIIPIIQSVKNNRYDYVLFEHLESLKSSKLLRTLFPKAKFILDAHNVDHILLKATANKARIKGIKKIESNLYKQCDLVLVCSKDDQVIFERLNKNKLPVCVVPNGVDIDRNSYQLPDFASEKINLIFCGSLDYEPNSKGLSVFLTDVWPGLIKRNAAIKLLVVGKGQPEAPLLTLLEKTANIDFTGEVDDVVPYYRKAHFAVVPLLNGSGTRLKVLESMSLGVPVLSTTIGAEGINSSDGENILICNTPADYISAITSLKAAPQNLATISKNARELVEKEYSWNVIGEDLFSQFFQIKQAI